ncbi:hypothetical protein BDP81DRAFT_415697 [Colletotrichum phormii]|uniref:Uncharacterized protein n=1 Tax=Colletotrichum phormii TaxID=359342 RepID=A0AAJ0EMG2_9PEZI|nr:uncharacterized protein BDP81DRAFT_415697 [Colletotrichum phormii]KAK1654423.1 hypothetical protein BDP81DRAFT_415697 [Colletotrichum phormii]
MQVRYTCVGVFWGWAFRFRWTVVGVTVVPGNVWRVSVVPRVTARLVGCAICCLMPRSRSVVRPRFGRRLTSHISRTIKGRRRMRMMIAWEGLRLDLELVPSACAVKWLEISWGFF